MTKAKKKRKKSSYQPSWLKSELASLDADHSDMYGVPYNYKGLCENLGIRVKNGASKTNQVEDLSVVFDLEINKDSYPPKYIIHGYNGVEYIPQDADLDAFETVIMQMLSKSDDCTIYYTSKKLLYEFGLVNNNYLVLQNIKNEERLTEKMRSTKRAANISGNILTTYMKRAIKRLEKKRDILIKPGYCTISAKWYDKDKAFYVHKAVTDEKLERELLNIESTVLKEMGCVNGWIPNYMLKDYYKEISERVRALSHNEFCSFYRVNVISSSTKIVNRNVQEAKELLNKKAIEKIMATTQLDFLMRYGKRNSRQTLIDEIICLNPVCNYESMLLPEPEKE